MRGPGTGESRVRGVLKEAGPSKIAATVERLAQLSAEDLEARLNDEAAKLKIRPEKLAKAIEETRRRAKPNGEDVPTKRAPMYFQDGHGTWWNKPTNEGERPTLVANIAPPSRLHAFRLARD